MSGADYSPGLAGLAGQYASADLGDADDLLAPSAVIDIGGHGIATPYGTAVNSMLMKQLEEIRTKSQAAMQLPSGWKKRMKEFLIAQNTQLLDYLKVTVPSHPTFSRAEILLRRFGNPNAGPSHPSVKEFVMDGSGVGVAALEALEARLERDCSPEEGEVRPNIRRFLETMRILFHEYREAGEALLRADGELRARLERLDKLQSRLSTLFEVDAANPAYAGLMESTEAYLREAFAANQIEKEYQAVLEAYRKFIVVKDIVSMVRFVTAHENEPICSICLQDSVTYALTPCGHTFCTNCARRQIGTCFVCRTSIRDRVRLYFG